MSKKLPPFTNETFIAKNNQAEVSLKVNYKSKNNKKELYSYILKLNGREINNSSRHRFYYSLWKNFIDMCLSKDKINRVLIVGGGDQFLANYVLDNYQADITLIDKNAFLYLQHNIAKVLRAYPYLSIPNKKFIALDMDIREAYEDEVIKDEEFDLILVDHFRDTLEHKTTMYEPDVAVLYKKLLKDKGNLIINHDFSFKEYNPKVRRTFDLDDLQKIRYDIKYYKDYMNTINSLLCNTDYLYKGYTKIALYSKVLVGVDHDSF